MENPKEQLYVLSASELNAIGALVKKLPIETGLSIWNLMVSAVTNNKIEDKLKTFERLEVAPVPKASKKPKK